MEEPSGKSHRRVLRRIVTAMVLVCALAQPPGSAHAQNEAPEDDAYDHPARTRLFFSPTARPVKAGTGYIAVYELFFPMVGVGVTDFLLLTGGISLLPGADDQLFFVAPKATVVSTGSFALAGAMTYIGTTGDGDGAGILYSVATFGGSSGSITGGLGWGFTGEEIGDRPVVVAGFQLPLGGDAELVSENWFPPDFDPALLSLGLRISSGSVSGDFAVWTPSEWRDNQGLQIIPWVSVTYAF